MTPTQIELVQSTWKQVEAIAEQAASLFYGKLFELDPEVEKLFTTDLEEQGKKLMQMIAIAVNGLTRLDEIVPAVEQLGRRHVDYRVLERDYATVGSALLWTLEQGLQGEFTPEVKEAWSETYALLANVMTQAARKAVA
ncbi:MAG: hypothetical protein KDA61_00895 [Planctomycetales bacterium]|nr:hypothetical protein [Planctomycetales bacterium]